MSVAVDRSTPAAGYGSHVQVQRFDAVALAVEAIGLGVLGQHVSRHVQAAGNAK
jgi:hypothetical protein